MSELPEPWSTAAERAGVRQTYRGIGDAAGLSHVTVKRLIAEGRTSQTTITKVAEALRVARGVGQIGSPAVAVLLGIAGLVLIVLARKV